MRRRRCLELLHSEMVGLMQRSWSVVIGVGWEATVLGSGVVGNRESISSVVPWVTQLSLSGIIGKKIGGGEVQRACCAPDLDE